MQETVAAITDRQGQWHHTLETVQHCKSGQLTTLPYDTVNCAKWQPSLCLTPVVFIVPVIYMLPHNCSLCSTDVTDCNNY